MPKISIIVAVYNTKIEYLKECIDSLRKQTLKDLEILLIDDGSEQECAKKCDEYQKLDERIRVIHKENEGVSIASNLGIEMATGEYLTFVDNDDWIDLDACEKVYHKITQHQADVVMWNYYSYCKDKTERAYYKGENQVVYQGKEIQKLQTQILDVFAYEEQQISLAGANWCKLYRTKLLKENPQARFPEHMMGGEDAIFTYKALACAEKVVFWDEPMYYYRQSEISYTKRFKPEMVRDEVRLLNMYYGMVKGNDKQEIALGKLTCNSLIAVCQNYIYHKDHKITYWKRRKLLKEILQMEEYRRGLEGIGKYHFNKAKRVFLTFAKYHLVDLVLLGTKIYTAKSEEERF